MNKEYHRFSDLIDTDSELSFEGDFSLGAQFTYSHTHSSTTGDFYRSQFKMTSDFGNGDFLMLGTQYYTAVWETYGFKQGTIFSARVNQPFVGIFFQLSGTNSGVHTVRKSTDLNLDISPGEANLIIMPA